MQNYSFRFSFLAMSQQDEHHQETSSKHTFLVNSGLNWFRNAGHCVQPAICFNPHPPHPSDFNACSSLRSTWS